MLSSVKRSLGLVTVTESKGYIRIEGIPVSTITDDILKRWETSRITKHMFSYVGWSHLVFPSFFALEVAKIFLDLISNQNWRTNRRALKVILEELYENTWLKRINEAHDSPLDYSRLSEIKFKLLPHQMEFLDKYNYIKPRYGLSGCLLMVPPGGGKTISDISIAVCAKAEVVIIISPLNAVREVWQKTLLNDMSSPQRVWLEADKKPMNLEDRWFIFHYESLESAIVLAERCKNKRVVIILDESHSFNDPKSLRTQRFLTLCKAAKPTDIIWASGTPIKALGSEAVPLLKSIDPLFTDFVAERFRKMYNSDSSKCNEILNYRLGLISYKAPKSNFVADKPIIEDRYVKIPNGEKYTLPLIKELMINFIKERKAYYDSRKKEMTKYYYDTLKTYHEPTLSKDAELKMYARYSAIVKKLSTKGFDPRADLEDAKFCNQYERQIISPKLPSDVRKLFMDYRTVVKYVDLKIRGECLGRILSKEREQCNVDLLASVPFAEIIDNALKKTLIFTSYVNVVNATRDKLTNDGYSPLVVYGATNSQLQPIIKSFTQNQEINPLIATYQSLSSAVPVLAANTLIMLNSPFRFHEQEQAISRCSRIGQDSPVYVYRYFLDTDGVPNISTRSEDIFEWSKQQVNQILGTDLPEDNNLGLESLSVYLPEGYFSRQPSKPFHPVAQW